MMKYLILTGLMIAMIFSASFGVVAQSQPVWSTVGDGNRDGVIDAYDAMTALYMGVVKMPGPYYVASFGIPADQLSDAQLAYYYDATCIALDVNKDHLLGAADALMILQYAVGNRDSFPQTSLSGIQDLTWPEA